MLDLTLRFVQHQRIELQCPWQNGRIERYFGTLKAKLDSIAIVDAELPIKPNEFRCWYHHARPHQHLGGLTPAEAWKVIGSRRGVRRGSVRGTGD